MSYQKITNFLYGYSFFNGFILIYPIYAIMFTDRGLTAAQISSMFIVWSLSAFLLEVPSGAIADRYPRKLVLLAALLFRIGAFAIWLAEPTYLGYTLGFILWGIDSALASGTTEAFVYDELERLGKANAYAKVTGRIESFDLIGTIAAGVAASALVSYGYNFILGLSIASLVIAGLVLVSIPKAKAIESTEETKYLSYLQEGVKLAFQNARIFFIVLLTAVITGLAAVDEYYSLFFQEKHFSLAAIAFWSGAIYVFGIIGSSLAYTLERKHISLALLLLVWAALLFGSTIVTGLAVAVSIGLFVGMYYLIKILANTYLQQSLSSKTRATTTSVSGLLAELFALVVFGVFAIGAQAKSYAAGLRIIAILLVATAAVYALCDKRYRLTKP